MKISKYLHKAALEADNYEEGIFQMLNAIYNKLCEISEEGKIKIKK